MKQTTVFVIVINKTLIFSHKKLVFTNPAILFFYFLVILDFYCQFFIYFLLDQNSKLYLEYCKPKLPLSITENQATLPSLFNQISTLLFLKLFSFIRKTPHSSVRKQEKMGSISLTKLTLGMGTGVLLQGEQNENLKNEILI